MNNGEQKVTGNAGGFAVIAFRLRRDSRPLAVYGLRQSLLFTLRLWL